ncbi:MAG: 6-phosphogluconolactonase [Ferruginibacter sp.]
MNNKHVFDDVEAVCKAAADYIFDLSKKMITQKGIFTIALSGGNTPRKLYELLSIPPYSDSLNWNNIFIFWSDERCVPLSDRDNNSHMAFTSLLNKVLIPKENIFPIPVNFEPAKAATSYEQTLKDFFKEELPVFDLILLGLGDNGHTASLFPFTSILEEKKRIVKEIFIEEIDAFRISFTSGLINHAENIIFLVTGDAKASMVKTVFCEPGNPKKYPAQLIRKDANWFLDRAAASQL